MLSAKNFSIVPETPVYLLTIPVIALKSMSSPLNSAAIDAATVSLTPSCKVSHPEIIGTFFPNSSRIGFPNSSTLSPTMLVSLVSICPRTALVAPCMPPVTKAFNGSCPYTTAVAALAAPLDTAAETVAPYPASANAGSTYADTLPPTLPAA